MLVDSRLKIVVEVSFTILLIIYYRYIIIP